jgi:hypothetical protein
MIFGSNSSSSRDSGGRGVSSSSRNNGIATVVVTALSVNLYIHCPKRNLGIVLNWLSSEKNFIGIYMTAS